MKLNAFLVTLNNGLSVPFKSYYTQLIQFMFCSHEINNFYKKHSMTKLFIVLIFYTISPVHPVPPMKKELPGFWHDDWIIGFSDAPLNIQSNFITHEDETLNIIEIQTFLDEWSVITANSNKRCNNCHVFKELHSNVLTMQTSECLSQVRGSRVRPQ